MKLHPVLSLLLCLVIIFIVAFIEGGEEPLRDSTNSPHDGKSASALSEGEFNRHPARIEYSKHARCRMKCRNISESELQQVLSQGRVNYTKSELDNQRCPRFALEGRSSDGQDIRVIFAQCKNETAVVTVIDLRNEWRCNCE